MKRFINDRSKKETRRYLRKSQTPEEILLWSKIRNNQIGYKWKRQVSIGFYVADFYCREKLLAIEIDGSQHLDNKEYDKERSEFFETLGIKTLRFWNSDIVKDLGGVMKIILKNLEMQPHPTPSQGGEEK